MKIAVDAMGGDFAPEEVIKGSLEFAGETGIELLMVGNTEVIRRHLPKLTPNISLVHSEDTISMGTSPTEALKKDRDYSIVRAIKLLKNRKVEAIVSAGNTGATMATALTLLGRIKNIKRPAIAIPLPSMKKYGMLLDAGAMVDCNAQELTQFALMGKIYSELSLGFRNPRIGLLNIGQEEGKGNEVTRRTYQLLKNSRLNFVGNIEGNQIFNDMADVLVCDGFIGNILLKTMEGLVKLVSYLIKNSLSKMGVKGDQRTRELEWLYKTMDHSEYGGAPLLGVKGPCIIAHGSSNAKSFKNALFTAKNFRENNIVSHIEQEISGTQSEKSI